MITKITCCHNCNTRHQGCHSECKKYQQQRQQLDEFKKKRQKEKQIDRYFSESIQRYKQLSNKRGNFIATMSRSV